MATFPTILEGGSRLCGTSVPGKPGAGSVRRSSGRHSLTLVVIMARRPPADACAHAGVMQSRKTDNQGRPLE